MFLLVLGYKFFFFSPMLGISFVFWCVGCDVVVGVVRRRNIATQNRNLEFSALVCLSSVTSRGNLITFRDELVC